MAYQLWLREKHNIHCTWWNNNRKDPLPLPPRLSPAWWDLQDNKSQPCYGLGYFTSLLEYRFYPGETKQEKIDSKNEFKMRWTRQWLSEYAIGYDWMVRSEIIHIIGKYVDYYRSPFMLRNHIYFDHTPTTSPSSSEQEEEEDDDDEPNAMDVDEV